VTDEIREFGGAISVEDKRLILDRTERLWELLAGQRVFITGGTGFFGLWLLQSFAWANREFCLHAEAVVLSRNWPSFAAKAPQLAADPAISGHAGDVRNFVFPSSHFSHVIHAATEASAKLNRENPRLMLDTIVEGTRRTLDFARHCGAGTFLLCSSGAVYGAQPPELTHIPEDYAGAPEATDPHSSYGEGKRTAEQLCALYARQHGIAAKIARGFAFVGPGLPLDAHFAVGNFIRDALRGGPITVQGDGTPCRSYLYAADLAIWLWTILLQGKSGRPYNVGSEEAISIADLAQRVADRIEPRPEVRISQSATPGKLPERYVPSTARARTELGLCQNVSLALGIERTIDYHRSRKEVKL
jgi:nucleoside-diphosphate-sugar epimerase